MTTYVLVHGSWHGAWCWYKVTPRLRAGGHEVRTVDLPAHGIDTTPVASVTFDQQVDRVASVLADHGDPVVLVGHSHGGLLISQVAERHPDAVASVVYLSGFLLADDQPIEAVAHDDTDSLVVEHRRIDADARTATIPADVVEDAFYADCPPEDVTLAKSLLRPAPLTDDRIATTASNYGSIPRVYIRCTEDRANTPEMQDEMLTNRPCATTYTLQTGHAPFFAAPAELVDILTEIPGE